MRKCYTQRAGHADECGTPLGKKHCGRHVGVSYIMHNEDTEV